MSFQVGFRGCYYLWWSEGGNFTKFIRMLDWLVPTVFPALCLGRLANFINGELIGRITEMSWGG